jgi:hypothetical protein
MPESLPHSSAIKRFPKNIERLLMAKKKPGCEKKIRKHLKLKTLCLSLSLSLSLSLNQW